MIATYAPVLCTVGLQATFWNMNSSVMFVRAAQGSNKENELSISEELFKGGFFNFSWAKKVFRLPLKFLSFILFNFLVCVLHYFLIKLKLFSNIRI